MLRRRRAPERPEPTGGPRRSAGRHSRRSSRFTPRRWLPFLALVGLTAGAVVVVQTADPATPEVDHTGVASAPLPVTATEDAISTAWYCGGGTARGSEGPAELTVVIANQAATGTTAELTVVGDDGRPEVETVDVPARGSRQVEAAELLTSDWVAMTVELFGGRATVSRLVRGDHGFDTSPCSTQAAEQWFVPSGSTERGATEALVLYNPFPGPTSVDVSFATDEGPRTPRALKGLSIPAGSFQVLSTDELPARRPEVATRVVARTGRVVVDRVQIYDGTGDPVTGADDGDGDDEGGDGVTTPAPEGLVSTPAIPTASPRLFFADARLAADARTQVAVYNPSSRTAEIDVVISYQDPTRAPVIEPAPMTVRGGEEQVLDLTDLEAITPDLPFSVEVRSLEGVPVAAELLVFGAVDPGATAAADTGQSEAAPDEGSGDEGAPDEGPPDEGSGDGEAPDAASATASTGLAAIPGSPVAATTWSLSRLVPAKGQGVAVTVANPGPEPVRVRAVMIDDGRRSEIDAAAVEIPARDRRRLDLEDVGGASTVVVEADGPVVASYLAVDPEAVGVSASVLSPWPETLVELPAPPSDDGS